MSESSASWSVVTVRTPAPARSAEGPSPVDHSDWVRLFLGGSFARVRTMGDEGAPSAIEYLVSGTQVVMMASTDESMQREASQALASGFDGLQELLAFHRRRVELVAAALRQAQPNPNLPYELMLSVYPMLMCVTVSDDPEHWIATDEGLCIVRWGLEGPGHRPLLEWSDADLAAMRRKVFDRARLRDPGPTGSVEADRARVAMEVVAGFPAPVEPGPKDSQVHENRQRSASAKQSPAAATVAAKPRATDRWRSSLRDWFAVAVFALSIVVLLGALLVVKGAKGRPGESPTADSARQIAETDPGVSIAGPSSGVQVAVTTPPTPDPNFVPKSDYLAERKRAEDAQRELRAAQDQQKGLQDKASLDAAKLSDSIDARDTAEKKLKDLQEKLQQTMSKQREADDALLVLAAVWLGQPSGVAPPPQLAPLLGQLGGRGTEKYRTQVRDALASQERDVGALPVTGLGAQWRKCVQGTGHAAGWALEAVRVNLKDRTLAAPLEDGKWHWIMASDANKLRADKRKSKDAKWDQISTQGISFITESGTPIQHGWTVAELPVPQGDSVSVVRGMVTGATKDTRDPSWREAIAALRALVDRLAVNPPPGGAAGSQLLRIPEKFGGDMFQTLAKALAKTPAPPEDLREGFVEQLEKLAQKGVKQGAINNLRNELMKLEAELKPSDNPVEGQASLVGVIGFPSGADNEIIVGYPPAHPDLSGDLLLVPERGKPRKIGSRNSGKNLVTDTELKKSQAQFLGCAVVCRPTTTGQQQP